MRPTGASLGVRLTEQVEITRLANLSVRAERVEGVEVRGAARGQPAGRERHGEQGHCGGAEDARIARADVIEKRRDESDPLNTFLTARAVDNRPRRVEHTWVSEATKGVETRFASRAPVSASKEA
jgi:hypothetical protein